MKLTIHFPNLIASTFMKTGSEMRSLGCYLVLYGTLTKAVNTDTFFKYSDSFPDYFTFLN